MSTNVEYLPKDALVEGISYYCVARNFIVGKWNGECFEYTRGKFGSTFQDTELHWDDGPPFGTVKPLAKILED
jgi:hypothetical protein